MSVSLSFFYWRITILIDCDCPISSLPYYLILRLYHYQLFHLFQFSYYLLCYCSLLQIFFSSWLLHFCIPFFPSLTCFDMLNLNRVVNPKQPLYLHKVGVRFAYRPLSQDSTYGITQDTLLLSSGKFLYAHEEHIKKEKEIWKQESHFFFSFLPCDYLGYLWLYSVLCGFIINVLVLHWLSTYHNPLSLTGFVPVMLASSHVE